MENEVWKDIPRYEGLYQASNLGRIRSCARTIIRKNKIKQQFKGKILSPEDNGNGYLRLILYKNKKKNSEYVHRLVAQAYLKNYSNTLQVNHINGIKIDNRAENLEMVTTKENMQKAVEIGLFDKCKEIQRKNAIKNNLGKYHILANESAKKRVAKYDKNNNLIQVYNSISEASRKNNINITSISYSANGKRKTGGGYIWHFV